MTSPPALSASVKGSFAYYTIKDRLPTILTRVIDHLCREKIEITTKYGEWSAECNKIILGKLSRLKNELQTNKPITLFTLDNVDRPTSYDDTDDWNKVYELYVNEYGEAPKWFTADWLYVECYMYKRIHNTFSTDKLLHDYDPFRGQKETSLNKSLEAIESLASFTLKQSQHMSDTNHCCSTLSDFLEISLWGNQCDLSISGGEERAQDSSLLPSLCSRRSNILVNHSQDVWSLLYSIKQSEQSCHIALVLDNAGFELVSDLSLLTFLTEACLCHSATIYVKTRPWFVSDTTKHDFDYTLNKLSGIKGATSEVVRKWQSYIRNNKWVIKEDNFWTTPHDFSLMNKHRSDLYNELGNANLIIFKGDLNYRKLVGDLNWSVETDFKVALRGFLPTSLVALRTAKGGPVVGLSQDIAYQTMNMKSDWNESGDYGLIQLASL